MHQPGRKAPLPRGPDQTFPSDKGAKAPKMCRMVLLESNNSWSQLSQILSANPWAAREYTRLALLLAGSMLLGCESKVVIGNWACPQASASSFQTDAGASDAGASNQLPWSTGFEDMFCDYSAPGGFCHSVGAATYKIVTAPVHKGNYAAAYTVFGDTTMENTQARCVREGPLPTSAYYGAWYYVPSVRKNSSLWNLIHFRGGNSQGSNTHGLWDISLVNDSSGGLRLTVYDFLGTRTPDMSGAPAIPVGSWFHIEMFLKRAADATGEVVLYQDGVAVLQLAGQATDDSQWGQWYVGNSAIDLEPAESTLYVDDVTISATR